MGARRQILGAAVRERLTHDLGPLRRPVAESAFAAARLLLASPSPARRARAFAILMRLHSGAFSEAVDARIGRLIRDALADERRGRATGLSALFDQTIQRAVEAFRRSSRPTVDRFIGSRLLVVKAFRPGERGVLVVDYSYVFPLLAGLFDLPRIAERYWIVLEPSWAGACTPEILLYTRLDHPVFVETIEPRDQQFLAGLGGNLTTVPVAANWWVDHRLTPTPSAERDIDVIMVASWAAIKRHWRVFRALARLRGRGHRLSVALVGYPGDMTLADIEDLATHFGIRDQVETFERISQQEVSALLARSKIHVLWSRRECANRAIIEAMLADVPVIVREGLTFGFQYPYINEATGRFVAEADLEEAILEMIATRDRYRPREWVLAHMTGERATQVLAQHVRACSLRRKEPWTSDLVVKTSTLDTQRYIDPAALESFSVDYAFIRTTARLF